MSIYINLEFNFFEQDTARGLSSYKGTLEEFYLFLIDRELRVSFITVFSLVV